MKKIIPISILFFGIMILSGCSSSEKTDTFNSFNDISNSGKKYQCYYQNEITKDMPIFVEGKKFKYTTVDNNEKFTQLFDGENLYSFYPNQEKNGGVKLSFDCPSKTSNPEIRHIIEGKLMPFDNGVYNCKVVDNIDFSVPLNNNWIDSCQIILKRDSAN